MRNGLENRKRVSNSNVLAFQNFVAELHHKLTVPTNAQPSVRPQRKKQRQSPPPNDTRSTIPRHFSETFGLRVIKCSDSPLVGIDRSNPRNVRVVAMADIPPNEYIATYPGWVYPKAEFQALVDAGRRGKTYVVNMFRVTGKGKLAYDMWVDPTDGVNTVARQFQHCIGPFVNEPSAGHSGNVRWVYDFRNNTIQYWSRTAIPAGHELLLCYGMEYNRNYSVSCQENPDYHYIAPGMNRPAPHTNNVERRLENQRPNNVKHAANEEEARQHYSSLLRRVLKQYKERASKTHQRSPLDHHSHISTLIRDRHVNNAWIPQSKNFWSSLGTRRLNITVLGADEDEILGRFSLYLPEVNNLTFKHFKDLVLNAMKKRLKLPKAMANRILAAEIGFGGSANHNADTILSTFPGSNANTVMRTMLPHTNQIWVIL